MRKTKDGRRRFSREVKIGAVKRIQQGEKPAMVARNLSIDIALLSKWCRQVRAGGEGALKEVGRPKGIRIRGSPSREKGENRVAQLERLVGRQQAAIDFLEQALRRVEGLRQNKKGNGGMASLK